MTRNENQSLVMQKHFDYTGGIIADRRARVYIVVILKFCYRLSVIFQTIKINTTGATSGAGTVTP